MAPPAPKMYLTSHVLGIPHTSPLQIVGPAPDPGTETRAIAVDTVKGSGNILATVLWSMAAPSGGGGSTVEAAENLTTQVDGHAQTFNTTAAFAALSLRVFLSGVLQIPGVDYSEDPGLSSFTFLAYTPAAPDSVFVEYLPA